MAWLGELSQRVRLARSRLWHYLKSNTSRFFSSRLNVNRNAWILTILLGLLGALYVYFFTDWLAPKRIQIVAVNRPGLSAALRRAISPVSFILNGNYRLTRLRVFPLSRDVANSATPPTWELTSSSNSVPIQGFLYGQRVPGMKPTSSVAVTKPLAPDTVYRLSVEAGRAKGEVDFRTPPGANN
jgi:hypothetical protein